MRFFGALVCGAITAAIATPVSAATDASSSQASPSLATATVDYPKVAEIVAVGTPVKVDIGTGALVVPALTPVQISLDAELGSKLSTSLQTFPIHLAEPVRIGDAVVIPAGATGMGEVVHAKKASGSGVGGELVLAARFLTVDGRQMRLRSLDLRSGRAPSNGANGESSVQTANMLGVFAGGAGALVGFMMRGKEITIPAGTIVNAKVAQDFALQDLEGLNDIEKSQEPATANK